jgi:hypothetical protein
MLRVIAALLVATAVVALGAEACVHTGCDSFETCPCSDGTTQLTNCKGQPDTCQEACDSHGGLCLEIFDTCQCSCGTAARVASSNCTVYVSTCEAACEQLGGVADAGAFDGSCPHTPDECSKEHLSPAEVLSGDGGYVRCFCSGTCCFATPDGGAPCPE